MRGSLWDYSAHPKLRVDSGLTCIRVRLLVVSLANSIGCCHAVRWDYERPESPRARTGKGGARCGAAGVLADALHVCTLWLLDAEVEPGRIVTLELAVGERLA